MTFLNPALFWGLLSLAVPIIVHFFNLQRPKEVLFSNVAFVKEVKQSVVRRLRFQRWILLLMRLLALTMIVFAFANPVILTENQTFLQGSRSVAIVIDDSYSMSAGNEKGAYFQQAVSFARNIIKAYDRQDEFLLMPMSKLRLNYDFGGQDEILEELSQLDIHQNTLSQGQILGFLDDIFARANYSVQELYVLSDFQVSTFMTDSLAVSGPDSSTLVKYIPLASREQRNVYIRNHQIQSKIIEPNKPVLMNLELVNDGEQEVNNLNIRVMVEGKAAAINNTNVEGNANKKIELSFSPSRSGWLSGYIEIDDNPIDFDNRRYFSFYVPESEKVLILENQSSRNVKILYDKIFSAFNAEIVSIRSASAVQFSDYKSIIIVGLNNLSSGFSEKIQAFLNSGGSLLIFPGDDLNIESANSLFSGLKIGSIGPKVKQEFGWKANQADLEHPVFEGIFSQKQNDRSFDAPTVYQYYPFNPSNQITQTSIIALENKSPLLIASELEQGLMYMFTTFPGDEWTDFHVKSIFAPLMYRLTQTMNQIQYGQVTQEIGKETPYQIRTSNPALIQLRNQENFAFTPEQYVQGGATILDFSKLSLDEGNYQIYQEEKLLEKISFNISDRESRLNFVNRSELGKVLGEKGIENVLILEPESAKISDQIREEKEGIPLWKYFLIAGILFLVIEIFILKFGSRTA